MAEQGATTTAPKAPIESKPASDKKTCNLLFPNKPDLKAFPYTPFIPTILAITLFLYPLINMEFKAITIKDSMIFYIVGFFIVFMQAFSSIFDSKWWVYYQEKAKAKGGFQAALIIISVALTSCIEKINSVVDIIGGMPGHVEYFNYPLNYMIFTGIIIAICIAIMGKITTFEKTKNIQDSAKTFVSLGKDDETGGDIAFPVIRILKWIIGMVAITLFSYNFSVWNMNTY